MLRRLSKLLQQSQRVECDPVSLIGEVEKRRLYAREASSSNSFEHVNDAMRVATGDEGEIPDGYRRVPYQLKKLISPKRFPL